MPIFDYRCKDCGEEFDLLIGKNASEEEKKCTKCGSKKIERKYSSFGVNMNNKPDIPSCPTCSTGTCNLN
jgi:putative FmdB family regulatory protein